MPTPWFYPTIISQTAEDPSHIEWDSVNDFVFLRSADSNFTKTTSSLVHIAISKGNAIKNKTWYLYLTGFNFTNIPQTISGLEAELHMNRGGRITDDTIQLRYDNNWIGDNKSSLNLDMLKAYGSSEDHWGVNLNSFNLLDPSFGIGIRFQSHPMYPHKYCTFA